MAATVATISAELGKADASWEPIQLNQWQHLISQLLTHSHLPFYLIQSFSQLFSFVNLNPGYGMDCQWLCQIKDRHHRNSSNQW